MPTSPTPHGAKPSRYAGQRPSANARGYGAAWQRARRAYLSEHPLCVACVRLGRVTPATVVDHVTPHRGDEKLMWDEANWQAMCKRHHDEKTARQDGGLGRPRA